MVIGYWPACLLIKRLVWPPFFSITTLAFDSVISLPTTVLPAFSVFHATRPFLRFFKSTAFLEFEFQTERRIRKRGGACTRIYLEPDLNELIV